MVRRALITGIAGQDGSYLAELLLTKGYAVHGIVRPQMLATPGSLPDFIEALRDRITLHGCDLETPWKIAELIRAIGCDECYHLAGASVVDSNLLGDQTVYLNIVESTRALLNAIRDDGPRCRFFFAGSSEMFGRAPYSPQDESTPFQPRSLYGVAKLTAFHLIQQYRRRHGVFACTGILYNHESPRRSPNFLPRKVSLAVARIKAGLQQRLALGNLDAQRDWGYAPDYVEAMWLILQQSEPSDFVIATGRLRQVRELVDIAFRAVDLNYTDHVDIDDRFYRPTEGVPLCGDSSRISRATGWKPRTTFEAMITEMVIQDMSWHSV